MVKVALFGIGGYAKGYVEACLNKKVKNIELVAACDPFADKSPVYEDLKSKNIAIYPEHKELIQKHPEVDLVVISSPLALHCEQTCAALNANMNVLCEKPMAVTIQEAKQMLEAEKSSKATASIGYQLNYSEAVHAIKQDLLQNAYGQVKRISMMTQWPRGSQYYNRNTWAGQIKTPEGEWVLDSPVSNATAHYLNLMLFLLGPSKHEAVQPSSLTATMLRANPITNFDTAFLKVNCPENIQLTFLTTHAIDVTLGPIMKIECEKGHLELLEDGTIQGEKADGSLEYYGSLISNVTHGFKLQSLVDSITNNSEVYSPLKASIPHIICMNAMYDSNEIMQVPQEHIQTKEVEGLGTLNIINDLKETMDEHYQNFSIPEKVGKIQTKHGDLVDLNSIHSFPNSPKFQL